MVFIAGRRRIALKAIGTAAVACVAMDREHEIGVSAAEFMVTLGDGCALACLTGQHHAEASVLLQKGLQRGYSLLRQCDLLYHALCADIRPAMSCIQCNGIGLAEIIIDQKADIANQKQHHCETQLAQKSALSSSAPTALRRFIFPPVFSLHCLSFFR